MNATAIKAKALEVGFDLIGIAPAVRFPEAALYHQWIELGFAGEMGYLIRNSAQRADPQVLFPPAQAIIVCGVSYHTPRPCSTEFGSPSKGWISRYAWGDDYHTVLRHKLTALLEWIQQETSTALEAKICVDTVPLLERLYGSYAGLGWIGKHSGLIHPQYGSWFFLGEILLNLDLESDAPLPDRCGTCTRCLDACPTGALVAPRILDARKCISYLTIEFKGIIPEAWREAIGNMVFGCDRCQEVCPWNNKANVPGHSPFLPRPDLYRPDLDWLFSLTPVAFTHIFKNNPMQRTKWRGLMRNTAIAIGNSGNTAFLPLLQKLSEIGDPVIKPHVEWAINQLREE